MEMNTNTKELQVAPFLVSKNEEKEFTTIISPEFSPKSDISPLLKKAVSRYNQETQHGKAIYTEIRDSQIGQIFLIFRTSWASEKFIGRKENITLYDSYSRPIPFIEGFVSLEPITDNKIAAINFNIVRQEVVKHYQRFWESGEISEHGSDFFKFHKVSQSNDYYTLIRTVSTEKVQEYQNKKWRCLNTFCLDPDARYSPEICSVTFSPDGKYIAARYNNQIIQIWDWQQNNSIKILNNCKFDSSSSLAFNPDGDIIATGMVNEQGEAVIKLWSWNADKEKDILSSTTNNYQVYAVAFYCNPRYGTFLTTGIQDSIIKLWKLRKGQENNNFTLHDHFEPKNDYKCFAINCNGTFMIGGDNLGNLRIWNFETTELIKTIRFHDMSINSITFNQNNKTFASSSKNKEIKICNIETKNEINCIYPKLNLPSSAESLAFHPINNEILVAGCNDNKTRVLDYIKGELITTLEEHKGEVTSVAFNPDGFLATGSKDGTVKIWGEN